MRHQPNLKKCNLPVWMIGLVFYLMCSLPVQPLLAEFGPCEIVSPAEFHDSITCTAGVCTGGVIIIPQQKSCGNANEEICSNQAIELRIDYLPKAVDQGWATFLGCCGLSSTCTACASLLGFVCGYTSGSTWLTCVIAAGCGVCSAYIACDYCCYTRCEQDFASRINTPGGTNC